MEASQETQAAILALTLVWSVDHGDRFDLDQEVRFSEGGHANERDCLQRVDAKGSGGSTNAFSERGDLVGTPVHDVDRELRNIREGSPRRDHSGVDVAYCLLNLRRKVSATDGVSVGVTRYLAGKEHKLGASCDSNLSVEIGLREPIRIQGDV